ncbi:MAG: DUF5011 domain-containing protein [Bacteroidetes bacterium]|nr:DUF5011 domain-containing protein [Bacteroidota bacterium]
MTKRILSLLFLLNLLGSDLWAQYLPVTISSGFNKDVIVNGTGAASASAVAFDASNFAFVAQDYPGVTSCFLPNSGIVSSLITPGLSFKMANYTGNNCFHVTAATGSSVLALSTPTTAKEVFLLWSSGQGTCVADVTVNFANSTSQTFTGNAVADWFGSGPAVNNIGRCNVGTGNVDPCTPTGPMLYQARLVLNAANQNTNIVSITVNKTSGAGYLGVFAVSILSNGPILPPIAGFYPSVPDPQYYPGMDTVYLGSPQKLVSISTNTARSYWDLPDEVVLNPGYSRTNVPFTSQTYIDTAKYSQTFTYNFNRPGYWPVRILSVGPVSPQTNRDSVTRYIYVDTPGTVPISNFFTARRKIGFAEYAPFVDLSDKGPNQWYWWFYRSEDSSSCNKCNNPPFFPNFFSNPYAQNPLFFGGDPGKWSVCLQTWNTRGWDTTCIKDYLEVLNSYSVCSGTGSSVVTDEEGFLFGAGGPGFSYTRGGIGACQGILIKPCADSIIFWFERIKMLPTDSMVFHNGTNASAPVLATVGGNGLVNIPASVRINGVRGGKQVFVRYKFGPQPPPVPYDSAGFTIRWEIKTPTYPKPTAKMNIPDTIYSMQPIQFQSQSSGVNFNYAWDTDGDFVYDSATANPTRTFLVNTTQYRTLCHVAYNCIGSDTVCKSVLFMPVVTNPTARFEADKLNGFNTDTFRLFDKSLNGPNSWRWTFTPAAQYLLGTNPTSRNPVVRLTLRTKYTVKLVVTNSFGKDSIIQTDYINIGAYDEPQCLNDIILSDGSIGLSRVILEGGIDTTFLTNATSPCYQNIQGNQTANLYRGQGKNLTLVRPVGTAVSPIDRKVWIDMNMDGMFGNDELVMAENGSMNLSKTEKILVPIDQRLGSTRMRIGVTYSPTTLNPSISFMGVFKDFVVNYPMDTVRPTALLNGTAVMETEINKPFIDPGITANDNIEGIISSRFQRIGNVDITKVGPNYLKYIVTDYYGNVSDTLYRTVFVILNRTGPSITLNGPAQQYVEVFNKYQENGAVARDNQDNILPANHVIITSNVDTSKLGIYNVNYLIIDAFGKTASVNRLVTVGDSTRPVIKPNYAPGKNYYLHQVNTAIDLQQVVTIQDNFWKQLTPTWSGTVDVNNVGTYFIPYNVTDGSGNIAHEVMVEIRVTDNIAPVIQLQGDNPIVWDVYESYIDPGFTVSDNVWPRNTIAISYQPAVVPVNSLKTINRWIIATDPSGNRDSVMREIRVVDRQAPEIKILGGTTMNINRWCEFVDPGVELVDNYNSDFEMRSRLVVTTNLPPIPQTSNRYFGDVPGLYSVNYRVTDLSGNTSTTAIRYVRVLPDACITGIDASIVFENILQVYPNPSSGIFNLQMLRVPENEVRVSVIDISGKRILQKELERSTTLEQQLDLSNQSKGIYILQLESGNQIFTRKIQVQ